MPTGVRYSIHMDSRKRSVHFMIGGSLALAIVAVYYGTYQVLAWVF